MSAIGFGKVAMDLRQHLVDANGLLARVNRIDVCHLVLLALLALRAAHPEGCAEAKRQ
jgi:hypothetical protein